ncbi:transposase [Dyadobacter fermentans]|uniref:transposase n=1 Tax=Dyadobacter fermentans TaxID=94254 RepID=UPI00339FD16F
MPDRSKRIIWTSSTAAADRFFNNRSTNASAESFNAKIKDFRSSSRGVRDIPFFLFRLTKLYA